MKKKLSLLLAVLLLATVVASSVQGATVLKMGSTGEQVKQLQNKLKRWGYYNGAVDGVFGAGTRDAVKYFQKKNGLTPDGVVGAATAKALGLASSGGGSSSGGSSGSGSNSNNNDLDILARCVYGEARGEGYKGQVAVAAVILNRVKSPDFPNSIAGVVYQSGAFDAVKDGQINLTPDDTAYRAARDAMNGYDPTNGCLYYYNPVTSTNKWMLSRPIALKVGNHVFCK